jgi:hypothetical protein
MFEDSLDHSLMRSPNDGRLKELICRLHRALDALRACSDDEQDSAEKAVCLASRAAFTEFSAIYEIDFHFHHLLAQQLQQAFDDALAILSHERYRDSIQQRLDDLRLMEQREPAHSDTSVSSQ